SSRNRSSASVSIILVGIPCAAGLITLGIRVYSDVILQAPDIRLPEGRKDASVPRHRLRGSRGLVPGLGRPAAARPVCRTREPPRKCIVRTHTTAGKCTPSAYAYSGFLTALCIGLPGQRPVCRDA